MWLTSYAWRTKHFWEIRTLTLLRQHRFPHEEAMCAVCRMPFSRSRAVDIPTVHTKQVREQDFEPWWTKQDFSPWHRYFSFPFCSAFICRVSLKNGAWDTAMGGPWDVTQRELWFHVFHTVELQKFSSLLRMKTMKNLHSVASVTKNVWFKMLVFMYTFLDLSKGYFLGSKINMLSMKLGLCH